MPKAPRRQTRWTLLIGSMSLLVVVGTVFRARDALLESWYLSRLESKDVDTRRAATERLGELRSVRAFPRLTKAAREYGLSGYAEGLGSDT